MNPRPQFQQLQYQLAAHLRDPQLHAAPAGIEDRRLKIYRELLYNNVEAFIANAFPVLRKISPDATWHARVRDFYARHACKAPEFYRIAEEFLEFLEQERGAHPDDPLFIRELCHYEWVELALSIDETELTPQLANPNGDLLDGWPLVSPLAWTFAYEFPVHRIGPDFLPAAPEATPTYLIVSRNRRDQVQFLEVNPVIARLMELLQNDHESSGRKLLLQIAIELHHPRPAQVVQEGASMLAQLRERDVVLGTRRTPARPAPHPDTLNRDD